MKVLIDRKDEHVVLDVTIYVPRIGFVRYEFEIILANKFYAGFVAEAIERQFQDHMEDVRKKAYEAGWKDAKGKRKKQTWFSRCW